MRAHFLGRISFSEALRAEREAYCAVVAGASGVVLGFECEKVITLGVRARTDVDLARDELELRNEGFEVVRVDRGGQATLHNPGQLVIFPVVNIREGGARVWVCALAKATVNCLRHFGAEVEWDEKRPGIYSSQGKMAAIGVRIRQGVSTHGVAINVSNSLKDFAAIRACGVVDAAVDKLGTGSELNEVFRVWLEQFHQQWPTPIARC